MRVALTERHLLLDPGRRKKTSFAYKHQTGVVKTSAAATVQELELPPPPPKKKIIEGSFPCPLHTLSLQSDKKSLVLW